MESSGGEIYLKVTMPGAERFISELSDPQPIKQAIAITFLNSVAEMLRTKVRVSFAEAKEKLNTVIRGHKLTLFGTCMGSLKEQCMDDSFTRLLSAWLAHNPKHKRTISPEEMKAILNVLYIHLDPGTHESFCFYDLMVLHFRWIACNSAAMEVFVKFSEGHDTMTSEQLARFLRETQQIEVTDRQILDKLTYRYGGVVHRYNFACYNGSVLTNCAIDPTRTSDVWQDMTQPFTCYSVGCARVETPQQLQQALGQPYVRAFVLPDLKKSTHLAKGDFMCGSCKLVDIIHQLKKSGFTTNTYPIVLCLPPSTAELSLEDQREVANLISEGFGSLIAKGLMQEGAVISDPKFSPGALRNKVLIMGSQSPLKPFVGMMVVDMNKDGLGVRVADVVDGTPAAKSGVGKDDWLTHINGKPIANKLQFRQVLDTLPVGHEVELKRENMDVLKIIIGGVANQQDPHIPCEMSNLIFFKYTKETAPSKLQQPKPWDTNELPASQLLTSPTSSSSLQRSHLENHFAMVHVLDTAKTAPAAATAAATTTSVTAATATSAVTDVSNQQLSAATQLGVQFVDVESTERLLAWTRARFSDNGRSGYLLKTSFHNEVPRNVVIDIIVGPRAIQNPPLRTGSVELFGPGTARFLASSVTFTGCTESSICSLKLQYDVEGQAFDFIASFCPALCCPGFRTLPCTPVAGTPVCPGIHGTYVLVKIQ